MAGHKNDRHRAPRDGRAIDASRRSFLRGMRWAPMLFLPAPLHASALRQAFPRARGENAPSFSLADSRLTPHYPTKTPLDDVLRQVIPGGDEYLTEKSALEVSRLLNEWGRGLKARPPAVGILAKFVDASIKANALTPTQEAKVRSGGGLEVFRRRFATELVAGREGFLEEIKTYMASMSGIETAEFEVVGIEEVADSPNIVRTRIRYDFVATRPENGREERIGHWWMRWSRDEGNGWRVLEWEATEEILSRVQSKCFVEITSHALGQMESYRKQMLRGVDDWRTVLDGACGIDVYGNSGLAVGDADNDGFDDLYVCQPAGLPNRLYRNRGDGTFEDVTEKASVGVLDTTACALFADFENKGLQDLLVVCASGPLLFRNKGNGEFSIQRDAFKFARPPQGTFTHAAIADYDGDGRLDVYFCLYSYYLGLDQYHYPVPYFDARNGPPNFLFHNEGNASFQDRTEAAGLNAENDRYSFACAWGDCNSDGRPDLYVANDFGRNNLYRNNGDGTFSAISAEAGVEDVGAGMSACWFDFDNDGNQDIYVGDMWSSAGMRVSGHASFHRKEPENIRSLYRQHASGNSLYQNQGDGKFQNVSQRAGVDMGRWAWSCDAWDFDHDGYEDLYIANGYISGIDNAAKEESDLGSFFWRQVVAKSPQNASSSGNYERGWNAINELIRSDASWNGHERNVVYANNHDGTFSEVSGTVGLDLADDSRAFALADIDHDGRLELIVKNRTAPQLRIFRNVMQNIGNSIAFRLRGRNGNRDAVGTAVTVEVEGRRQRKYLQAGSGFLSQHTKELFFGVGRVQGTVRTAIRWPSGTRETFENLPVNHRIEIEEGKKDFVAKPFAPPTSSYRRVREPMKPEPLPKSIETWLIEPLSAPEFTLTDVAGNPLGLRSFRGGLVLLNFWVMASSQCIDQMRLLEKSRKILGAAGLQMIGMLVDSDGDRQSAQSLVTPERLSFPTVLATPEVAGVYNIIYRYLFDRRRDLDLPTAFLLNEEGLIVKVYQGPLSTQQLLEDVKTLPRTPEARVSKALPFTGTLYQGGFQRNDFTYGVALFQRGYLDQAAASFQQVIAAKPNEPEAYYNLGTLFLRKNAFADARRYLEQALKLRTDYPEAWNNLGMIAAQENQPEEAIRNFKQSLLLRPDYVIALLNLGNFYRRQEAYGEADKLLSRALELEPDNAEGNYSVGMLYARVNQIQRASRHLEKAVALRPDYADALNNLGVLLVREEQYEEAQKRLEDCIRVAPNFDQAYLNLARLYVVLKEKEKAREVLLALLHQQPGHRLAQQALEMLD